VRPLSLGPELISALAGEINQFYANVRIRKAEAAENWLALIFSSAEPLFFSWDPVSYGASLACISEIRALSEIAKGRPPFISAVRAHIVGSDLICASALKRDRILSIEFSKAIGAGFSRKRRLLFEASGRYSNILLLDEDERIIEAAKHIHADTNRYRSLLPGLLYTPPPPLAGIALEDFDPGAANAAEKLAKVVGVGRPLLSVIKKMCEESPEVRADVLGGLDIFRQSGLNGAQTRYFSLEGYITLFPTDLSCGAVKIAARSALEAARHAAILPLLDRIVTRVRKKLGALLENKLAITAGKISDAENRLRERGSADKELLYGKLILANAWKIPPRAPEAELSEWTEGGEVSHSVTLDPEKNAAANAERYFARYRKKTASVARAEKILPALRREAEDLQEQLVLLERQDNPATLSLMAIEIEGMTGKTKKAGGRGKARKAPSLAPHARYELPGATLLVGLSAKGNHHVTFRLAKSDDIWLHAQKIPGAHVILRFEGSPDEAAEAEALETAAACAAYYSKGKEGGSVRVDFTEKKHVRAIPGGGPAHVTYKEFGTITADSALWEKFAEGRPAALPEEKP